MFEYRSNILRTQGNENGDSSLRTIAHTTTNTTSHETKTIKNKPAPRTKNHHQSARPHANPHAQIPTSQPPPSSPPQMYVRRPPDRQKKKKKEAQATTRHSHAMRSAHTQDRRSGKRLCLWQRANQRRAPSTACSKMRGMCDVSGSCIWIGFGFGFGFAGENRGLIPELGERTYRCRYGCGRGVIILGLIREGFDFCISFHAAVIVYSCTLYRYGCIDLQPCQAMYKVARLATSYFYIPHTTLRGGRSGVGDMPGDWV